MFDPTKYQLAPDAEKTNDLWNLLHQWEEKDCIDYYDGPITLITQERNGQWWWLEDFGSEWKEGVHRRETWICVPISEEQRTQFLGSNLDYRNIKRGCQDEKIFFLHVFRGWKGKNSKGIYQWETPTLTLYTAQYEQIPDEWLPEAGLCYSGSRDLERSSD